MPVLGKKLQLKPAQKLLLVNEPQVFAQILSEEGYLLSTAEEVAGTGTYEAVLAFVRNAAELEALAPKAAACKPDAVLWIAYPKKSSGMKTDLTRDKGWSALTTLGFEAVRQVAMDETWSALRFKPRSERKEASRFGVDMLGIDRRAKTVVVPEDLGVALEEAELLEYFNSLAFTHRKEYVVSVLEAKKPETRARRISKAVEQLRQKQQVQA
ncbi:bacteriocin resistance YdeI/OmpD-like protein [Pontibacter ummariensis]|uniref:Bacteriocin-protection, YdeI or OmpD-Associated n=1 Tax=Pontibacter ummariensis TaxID=1610492 RepID=A0A239CTL7_9BACT|nr:YdeI/OmpD-associated family protein [Pontibacter ummariensis]PRY14843.1 bacteriocin resistance YdeI/OmpD-like protein [Pontibacter ummariensis]SNS23289.1 Bacteriocin-protection, YdeI or OmpD-Associated [Pontibacter ummariensis]